jgi:hypothetical protein
MRLVICSMLMPASCRVAVSSARQAARCACIRRHALHSILSIVAHSHHHPHPAPCRHAVSVQPGSHFLGEPRLPILGAEDEMHDHKTERLWHGRENREANAVSSFSTGISREPQARPRNPASAESAPHAGGHPLRETCRTRMTRAFSAHPLIAAANLGLKPRADMRHAFGVEFREMRQGRGGNRESE